MREARLIGGVNLADRVFNKKYRMDPAIKSPHFYEDFGEISPTPRCGDPPGDTFIFRRLTRTQGIYL